MVLRETARGGELHIAAMTEDPSAMIGLFDPFGGASHLNGGHAGCRRRGPRGLAQIVRRWILSRDSGVDFKDPQLGAWLVAPNAVTREEVPIALLRWAKRY